MQDVGIINKSVALSYGLSGPVSRSSGLKHDIRLLSPYEIFKYNPINTVFGSRGDNFTRFFLRFEEMFTSLQFVDYSLRTFINFERLFKKEELAKNILKPYLNEDLKETMENTIYQFKVFSEGFNIKENKSYAKVESPRGEFGVLLLS